MKRFLLFRGPNYYPGGGWEDFEASFDSLGEAKTAVGDLNEYDWYHVIDGTTGEQVDYGYGQFRNAV